jgi:hypothetical protein
MYFVYIFHSFWLKKFYNFYMSPEHNYIFKYKFLSKNFPKSQPLRILAF